MPESPNHRPGWLSSEAYLAAAVVRELARVLHEPHWPFVQIAAAAALAWVAVSYSRHRSGLKATLGPSRPVLARALSWLWTTLSQKSSARSRPPTAPPSVSSPERSKP